MSKHGKRNRGLVKRGNGVSQKPEIVFVAFVMKEGDRLVAVGAVDGSGEVDLSGVTTIRPDEAQEGEFIVGVVPRNKLEPVHVVASAVQVVPWTAFKESEPGKSIVEYIASKPTGELIPKYKSFLGTKNKAADIIVHDGNTYLKGFLSTGASVSYSHVKTFTQDFRNGNKGAEIRYGDGNAFTLLVKKPYDAKGIHPALICEGWATLRVPVDKLTKAFGVNRKILQKAAKESGTSDVYREDWIGIEDVEQLSKALLDHPEWTAEVEESRKRKKARAEEMDQQHKMEEDEKLRAHQQFAHAASGWVPEAPVGGQPMRGAVSSNGEGGSVNEGKIMPEKEFLTALIADCEKCGYDYNPADLIRFHTSVKCGMFTLLGGMPGCGKSSLVSLYARALLGNAHANAESGFLTIDVNPAWMEPSDILGYWNLRDEYKCSSTGLVPFLRKSCGSESVRLVCLDEMNLARVEHYFSNFIQMISRPEDERVLFGVPDADNVEIRDAKLPIAKNLRFVGTNNFDETTQRFSARFYDRCNYIELQSLRENDLGLRQDYLFPAFEPSFDRGDFSYGVSYANYEQWCRKDVDPKEITGRVAAKFRRVIEKLEGLKLVPSPRVRLAVLKYILNRPFFEDGRSTGNDEDCQMIALDEAIAQRILPKYCPSYLRDEKNACTALCDQLEGLPISLEFFRRKCSSGELPTRQ